MNPEHIHNALNYLEDDLIAETDALRQERQTLLKRPAVRKVITWVAPAVCLALVLGLGPRLMPTMESGTSTARAENEIQITGEWLQDDANYAANESKHQTTPGWQNVSCGDISIGIPETWTYELAKADDGSYAIIIRPLDETGSVRIGYWPAFGVCGTGLTEEKTVIAGMEATVGYYDGGEQWRFIVFRVGERLFVVTKDGAESWWGTHGDTAMQILETLVIAGEE